MRNEVKVQALASKEKKVSCQIEPYYKLEKNSLWGWVRFEAGVVNQFKKFCDENRLDIFWEAGIAFRRHMDFLAKSVEEQTELEIERLEEQEGERQFDADFLKDFRITDDGLDAQV